DEIASGFENPRYLGEVPFHQRSAGLLDVRERINRKRSIERVRRIIRKVAPCDLEETDVRQFTASPESGVYHLHRYVDSMNCRYTRRELHLESANPAPDVEHDSIRRQNSPMLELNDDF